MAKATLNTDVDPHEAARAQAGWGAFTTWITRSVIAIIATLVLMAWFFL